MLRTTVVLLVGLTARAATFTVNSTADLPDAGAGNGVCSTGRTIATGQAECTLRAAVQEASALAGADVIVVPAGTYSLSTPSLCNYKDRLNPSRSAVTSRTLCIDGSTTITGAGAASTIIDAMGVERVLFISDGATVTISGLTLQNGRNTGPTFDGRGAGINNQGNLTILDCSISNNTADGAGGGIHTEGTLTIRGSSVSNNSGIGAGGDGGGIWLFAGSLVVSDSTLDNNASGNGGGGIALYSGSASVTGSTFSNNTSVAGGGGLRLFNSSSASVANSTFSGNSATNAGGAIRTDTGTLFLNNVTVARNTVTGFGGAGVFGTMHMRNSIVAANTAINPGFFPGADCLAVAPGAILSEGHNLIQDARNCNITGDTTGNIIGQDAQLGGLGFNGGGTQTHALLAGSPALNAGSPASPGSGDASSCTATDQRGIIRPQGVRCDIGAFERNAGFAVSTITPARGGNSGSTVAIISGSGFADGASVRLHRSGQPDIAGSPATVDGGGFSLASAFDLTGSATGAWDVVVTNADLTVATIPSAFSVEPPRPPDLWSYVVGRSAIRPGAPVEYTIVYGNRGNVDALAVPLTLSVPGNFDTSIYFPITPPPAQPGQVGTDWSAAPLAVLPWTAATQLTVPLLIPVIPAGFSGALTFSLLLPPSATHGTLFSFSAILGNPILNPGPDPAALQRMVDGAVAYALELGVTVPAAALPAIRTYTANQMMLIVPAGHDQLVSTLGAQTTVYSLAQMNLDAAQYAASFVGGFPAAARNKVSFAGSSGSPTKCSGQVLGSGTSCGDNSTPVPPPLEPAPPSPKGIRPGQCQNIPNHHLTGNGTPDGTFCVPDDRRGCPAIVNPVLPDLSCMIYPVINSVDPNEKTGSRRGGNITAQTSGTALVYTVSFENQATASGAAQQVVVTDQLDSVKVDLSTLSLGPISFGNFTVVPPPGLSSYIKILDMRPAQNFLVKMEAALNVSTGVLTWRFSTLDPVTGQITTDPVLGFLPPNTVPPNGEGHAVFTAQPKQPIATGTQICNLASIVFDFNAPIVTNQWCNTMDDVAPVSRVQPLPAQSSSPFTVQWSGSDTGSGIGDFDIYVSDNGGAFTRWLEQTDLNQSPYTGSPGHTYSFFSLARDQAGNAEPTKTAAEAATSVLSSCAADVTAQYNIVRGGFRLDNASGRYVQTVTATTTSNSPAPQGLRFVLDGLTPNVILSNQTGSTTCAAPLGSPFVAFSPVTSNSPSSSGVLQFVNPGNVAIRYALRLLAPGLQP